MYFKKSMVELSVILSLLLLFGCGYHFRADGEPMGGDIPSLAIPLMESTSSTLGFESDFTKIIRDEFISHSNVPLVPQDEAALILEGKIKEIRTESPTYDITQNNVRGEDTYYAVTNSRRLWIILDARQRNKYPRP
jgi:outer membrane lipopolysaccharide assembly protein LptE/RlpB